MMVFEDIPLVDGVATDAIENSFKVDPALASSFVFSLPRRLLWTGIQNYSGQTP